MFDPIPEAVDQIEDLAVLAEEQAAAHMKELRQTQEEADEFAEGAVNAALIAATHRRLIAHARNERWDPGEPVGPTPREMAVRVLLRFVTDPKYANRPTVNWSVNGEGLDGRISGNSESAMASWALALDTPIKADDWGGESRIIYLDATVMGVDVRIWGTAPRPE